MNSGDPGGVSVLIVDDQRPFRAAARAVVRATAGFYVTGEASSGEEAMAIAGDLSPDLVLMDINMDNMNGIEATRRILQDLPGVAVILLSTYDEADLPSDALSCGAIAYVHKERFGPEVLDSLWRKHDGQSGEVSDQAGDRSGGGLTPTCPHRGPSGP